MSVGVCIAPQRSDTVEGLNMEGMKQCLSDLRPHTVRFDWAYWDAGTRDRVVKTVQFCQGAGIGVLPIVGPTKPVEQQVNEIFSVCMPAGIEGQNEPDAVGPYSATQDRPMTDSEFAAVEERQYRLYAAVAGRVPVLTPSSVYRVNDDRLAGLPGDYVSAHRYPDRYGAPPDPGDAELPVGKPVVVTEFGALTYKKPYIKGMPVFGGYWQVDEAKQRDHLVTFRKMLFDAGAVTVVAYRLMNPCTDDFKPDCGYGLYTNDGRPKLAAAALRGS